jgi:serine/threonine-protein kinase
MTPQQSIAHYRITSKLGEGGMGEVWRATDTKLNRDVAIKILPEAFASDPDRMVRFTREAQVLASLNHPHIAQIYGVEERALVMELVEGEMLSGPLPLETALDYARQISDALEAAHEKGIVHRDLKPGNIMITGAGVVKVLDFGLARVAEETAGDSQNSPTLTISPTRVGVILGTAPYMSPEQARGKTVDKRADIWAFGCVLYEMLTGKPAFPGETTTDILGAVVKSEPDVWQVPAKVRRLLRECLEKNPKKRLRDIGDAWKLLEDEPALPASAAVPQSSHRAGWIAAVAATLALVITAVLLWRATRDVEQPLIRLSVDLGPDALTGLNVTAAISPDGRRLVYPVRGRNGTPQLATRLLDQAEPTLLEGSEFGREPFLSPDGHWIGFFTNGKLLKIPSQGGAAITLSNLGNTIPTGASWNAEGSIVAPLGTALPLARIPESGGAPQPITNLGAEISHRWPQALPGGQAILYTGSRSASAWENGDIEAVVLSTREVKTVARGGYYGRYLPTGHLVYVHQGALFGMKFDPNKLVASGTPVPLLNDLAANSVTGGGQFDFSAAGHGTLIYLAGKLATQAWQMSWLDRSGAMQTLSLTPGAYTTPRFSQNGRKLAFTRDGNIYIYDLDRDTSAQLTSTGTAETAIWAPDGKHIVFRSGGDQFIWVRSDGGGDPITLFKSPSAATPWSFSPGGRLAYFDNKADTQLDIWTMPLDLTDPDHPKPGQPEPFLQTPAAELLPRFSPDGHWIAYRSSESGSSEIYVRPFPPGNGGKWQISTGGGSYGIWSPNGHELFYETSDNRIMVVDYTVDGNTFVHGKPRVWSDKQLFYTGTSNLDLAPDGKRFLIFSLPETPPGQKGSVHVTMWLNFFDEVKRRIP